MLLARARTSTFALFALNGFTLGMWVVHIPEIRDRTATSTVTLGYLLLLLGGTAFIGMQVGGRLIDHLGARAVIPVACVALSVSLIGPALATSSFTLAIALAVFGLFNGVIDVGQNAHAVEVERAYGRPILSAFHAFFSLGGLLAAVIGGGLLALGADLRWTLGLAAAAGVVLVLLIQRSMLGKSPVEEADGGPDAAKLAVPTGPRAPWNGRAVVLALHDSLGASTSTAAWAFGAFSVTMTAVRLVADRIVARIGAAAYVQRAAIVGAAGLLGAALAPTPVIAIFAWGIFGIGLAGCVPQFFSAAGNIDPAAAGTYLARVTGVGYLGLLAGPAIIGLLTHWVPLTTAFAVPIVGCLVSGLLAPSALRTQSA